MKVKGAADALDGCEMFRLKKIVGETIAEEAPIGVVMDELTTAIERAKDLHEKLFQYIDPSPCKGSEHIEIKDALE